MITAGTVLDEAFLHLQESRASQLLWTTSEIFGYLNEAQIDFILRSKAVLQLTTGMLTVINGQTYSYTPDMVDITRVAISGRVLLEVTKHELDLFVRQGLFNPAYAAPPRFYLTDAGSPQTFQLVPTPTALYAMDVVYIPYPVAVTADSHTFLVADVWLPYLKYYVLWRAWGKQGEGQDLSRASLCKLRYELGIKIARQLLEGLPPEIPDVAASFMQGLQGGANGRV